MNDLQSIFLEPAKVVIAQTGQFVISALLVLFILLIGFIISKIIKKVVTKLLKALKVDALSNKIGLNSILTKGGIDYSLSGVVGGICYWLALLITFVVALNTVGLTVAADLLQRITLFIPNIVAAIFILIVGMFMATISKNIVKTTVSSVGISQANLLSKISETVIMIFFVAMALEQLQIGAAIVQLAVAIILGSLGLGFALALGLGCKDIVARSVLEFSDKIKKQNMRK